jgi:DNA-binding HxlR family transcriptional regulator
MKTIERTCAIAYSINLLGDKWSLLILRDAILHKKSKFKEFVSSKEKIATNILTNRLKFLVEEGFLELLDPEGFKKNKQYLATERGLSALPIIMELYLFSIDSIEESILNASQIKIKKQITTNRKGFEKQRKKEYIEFVESLKTSSKSKLF